MCQRMDHLVEVIEVSEVEMNNTEAIRAARRVGRPKIEWKVSIVIWFLVLRQCWSWNRRM